MMEQPILEACIHAKACPDQQFSRATIFAYDGQVAVVRHYPHLTKGQSATLI
jgi:hypothetical protein